MLNQHTVIGRVVEVGEDKDAVVLVVRTGSGKAKNGGKSWEALVACRFWGEKTIGYAQKATPGAMVKIDAEVRSRKSDRGVWFSSVEARFLTVLAAGEDKVQTAPTATTPRQQSFDDDVPF